MTLHVRSFFKRVDQAKRRIRQVSAREAIALARAGAVVLDVRDEEEFGRGRIDGAILIGYKTLDEQIARLVPNEATPIVCYCSRGYRAAIAADGLQKLGYRNVVSIDGGLLAYLNAAASMLPVCEDVTAK
ncbi:MAG TPA: rhodanese-like domain-containing protein [Pyrinomonadaceae bacterium]|nr:rhodanese-like domain-containing protein [Pyrinomonadaceae bacterium]